MHRTASHRWFRNSTTDPRSHRKFIICSMQRRPKFVSFNSKLHYKCRMRSLCLRSDSHINFLLLLFFSVETNAMAVHRLRFQCSNYRPRLLFIKRLWNPIFNWRTLLCFWFARWRLAVDAATIWIHEFLSDLSSDWWLMSSTVADNLCRGIWVGESLSWGSLDFDKTEIVHSPAV